MTTLISIATTKPLTKRTAKGIILTGANGKRARRDGRHPEHVGQTEGMCKRPGLDSDTAIAESLEAGLLILPPPAKQRAPRPPRTSESPGFAHRYPTHRRRIRSIARAARVVPEVDELPQFDEAGRPIVYASDGDAWSLRVRR